MRLVLAALLLLAVAACGPVHSTATIAEAEAELEAARAAGAERAAPYELTSAEAYLHKAREEQGRSAYEPAARFAVKARDRAREAKQKAVQSRPRAPEAP